MKSKLASLDQRVRNWIVEKEFNIGIALAVVQGNEIAYEGAFGLRDRERRLPVTPTTNFEVSSLAKAFTATGMMIAQERGALKLDAPINSPRMRLELKDPEATRALSVADILAHRSGLPAHDCLWYFGPAPSEGLFARLAKLDWVPNGFRQTFVYNNLMYAALGYCFPELLGESWENSIQKHVLDPLGLGHTKFQPDPKAEGEDVALPYIGEQRANRKETRSIAAAGALRTNVRDLARWMMFHLGEGESGKKVLSPSSRQKLHEAQIQVEVVNPLILQGLEWLAAKPAYGFGWFHGETRGKKVLFHPALIDGYSAALVLVPEMKLGIAVLTNQNLSPVPGQISQKVLEHYLGEESSVSASAPAATPPDEAPAPSGTTPDHSALAGKYEDPAYGRIEIAHSAGQSSLVYHGNKWPLHFQRDDEATFKVTAFGLEIPLPAKFDGSVRIPFSLDPRVGPQVFARI